MEPKIELEELKNLLGEMEASEVEARFGHRLDEESRLFLDQMFILEEDLGDVEKHLPPLPDWQPPREAAHATTPRFLPRLYMGMSIAATLLAGALIWFSLQPGQHPAPLPDSDNLRSPQQSENTIESEFFQAVRSGNLEQAELLIESGAILSERDENGRIALQVAAANDDPDMLQLLLDSGSPLDKVDSKGQSALIIAASKGNLRCTELLLEAGADKSIVDQQGETAESHAGKIGYGKILELLQK